MPCLRVPGVLTGASFSMPSRLLYRLACIVLGVLAVGWGTAGLLRQHSYETELDDILLKSDAHQARFDSVRHFVHSHSRYANDAEYRRLVGHRRAMASAVIDHTEGRRLEPPHLLCGARAHLLADLYRRLGYRARLVAIFDTDRYTMRAHSFVDVFNPSTRTWESEDPQYNVYWRDVSSKKRVSVFDSAEDIGVVEPCGPTKCGWDFVSDEGGSGDDLRDLMDIVSVVNDDEDNQSTKITTRAKLDRPLSFQGREGRFCEIMKGHCDSASLD